MATPFFRTGCALSLVAIVVIISCGEGGGGEIVSLSSAPKDTAQTSESEERLGLVASRDDDEHWEMAKSDGEPALYRPENFDLAMKAFRRVEFENGQSCSGVIVHEADRASNDRYKTYFVTAHHCVFNVNPLGFRTIIRKASNVEKTEVRAEDLKAIKFKLVAFEPKLLESKSSKIFMGDDGKRLQYTRRVYGPSSTFESLEVAPEMFRVSDIIRFQLKSDLSLAEAQSQSLPICKGAPLPANMDAPLVESGASVVKPLRLMMGLDTSGSRPKLVIERMNGRHRQKGAVNGEFRQPSQLSILNNYVFRVMSFGAVSFYGYTSYFGGGAEGSDSGAPILFGEQESANQLKSFQGKKVFVDHKDMLKMSSWKVKSINCVNGVIVREVSVDPIKAIPAEIFGDDTSHKDIYELGRETTTIIQELQNQPEAWRKL